MPRQLRSWEILKFLENKNNSKNDAVKTLGVSKTTVTKVTRAWDELIFKPALDKYNNKTLNELLFDKKSDYDDCIIQSLKYLEKKGVSFNDTFKYAEESLMGEKKITLSHFHRLVRMYCKQHGFSDRKKFKPGNFAEIGWIDNIPVVSSKSEKTNIFYIYLPYSRFVYMDCSANKTQLFVCNALTKFFLMQEINGLPEKIIFSLKLNQLFSDYNNTQLLHTFFSYLDTGYNRNNSLCVFNKMESNLIKQIKSINKAIESKLRYSLKRIMLAHNTKYKRSVEIESGYLRKNEEFYGCILQEDVRYVNPMNCHIQYKHNYYSCPYQYCGKQVKVFTTPMKILIYDSEDSTKLLSSHNLVLERNKYSTNDDDMPINDEQRNSVNMNGINDYLEWAERIGDFTRDLCEKYINYTIGKRKYPEYAFPMIQSLLARGDVINEKKYNKNAVEVFAENNCNLSDADIPEKIYGFLKYHKTKESQNDDQQHDNEDNSSNTSEKTRRKRKKKRINIQQQDSDDSNETDFPTA